MTINCLLYTFTIKNYHTKLLLHLNIGSVSAGHALPNSVDRFSAVSYQRIKYNIFDILEHVEWTG